MPRRLLGMLAATGLAAVAIWACSQEDGDRCQLHGDCSSNYCCKCSGAAATESDTGICTAGEAVCQQHCSGDSTTDTGREDGTGADADADAADVPADVAPDADAADVPADVTPDADATGDADVPTDVEPEADAAPDVADVPAESETDTAEDTADADPDAADSDA
jgi:D-alanyl-D-alanine carboxypeptidase (penicillin-binding protein 5/6)